MPPSPPTRRWRGRSPTRSSPASGSPARARTPRAAGADAMLSLPQRAYFLGRVPLFAGLALADLLAIARIAEEVTAAPGQLLFRQGDPGDALWAVLDGEV